MSMEINTNYNSYQTSAAVSSKPVEKPEENKGAQDVAATYEKSSNVGGKAATYSINKMSQEDRDKLVSQLKADQEQMQSNFLDLVQKTIGGQIKTVSFSSEEMWKKLNQNDPAMQCWYYRSIAEIVELSLNKTGAFKEYIKHVNFIWPGTFDSEKARFRKYKEVSIEGCKQIGHGAKGDVYRYDDELVIKVYNENNTYRDVEREIALSRKAFILGVPTAISFGIVSVGEKYGAMFELVDSETVSRSIARSPGQVDTYAGIMANLARCIHKITATEKDGFPEVKDRLIGYIKSGVAYEDEALANKCIKLVEELPALNNLVHGDFHSGNVFMQKGEALLIDMDRISRGHPIAEIADLYYFYVVLGEQDPAVIEKFMGFSYEVSKQFFNSFLELYLDTEDEDRIADVIKKASLICYARMVHKLRTKSKMTQDKRELIDLYLKKTAALAEEIDTLTF